VLVELKTTNHRLLADIKQRNDKRRLAPSNHWVSVAQVLISLLALLSQEDIW